MQVWYPGWERGTLLHEKNLLILQLACRLLSQKSCTILPCVTMWYRKSGKLSLSISKSKKSAVMVWFFTHWRRSICRGKTDNFVLLLFTEFTHGRILGGGGRGNYFMLRIFILFSMKMRFNQQKVWKKISVGLCSTHFTWNTKVLIPKTEIQFTVDKMLL